MTADYAAALELSRVRVLESGDAMVGALVTEHRADHLLLETIAVAPSAQGSGYGRLLLERAERDAVELGLTEVLRVPVKPARKTREPTFTPHQRPEPTIAEKGGAEHSTELFDTL